MSTQFTGQPVRPYRAGAFVNAGSSVDVDYSIRDEDNALAEPATLEYRIDNLTDSVVIAGWTNIADPAEEGALTISAAVNVMTRQSRTEQLNQVSFRATFASGKVIIATACYELCAVLQGGS